MNINLELSEDLKLELASEAALLNLSLDEYIVHVLNARSFLQSQPRTGAQLVAYWENVGVLNSRTEITDSQEYARELRQQAEIRHQP